MNDGLAAGPSDSAERRHGSSQSIGPMVGWFTAGSRALSLSTSWADRGLRFFGPSTQSITYLTLSLSSAPPLRRTEA